MLATQTPDAPVEAKCVQQVKLFSLCLEFRLVLDSVIPLKATGVDTFLSTVILQPEPVNLQFIVHFQNIIMQ